MKKHLPLLYCLQMKRQYSDQFLFTHNKSFIQQSGTLKCFLYPFIDTPKVGLGKKKKIVGLCSKKF